MIESAGTTNSPARARTVCGARTALPPQLVVATVALAPPRTVHLDEIEAEPVCTLEEHTVGAHWGFVMDLDGLGTGAVWTPWTADRGPDAVVVLPDCPAISVEPRAVCGEFAAHPGAHSWEVQDLPEDSPGEKGTEQGTSEKGKSRVRTKPRRLHHAPEAVTWAREKAGLTKRELADLIGISEQLMGEIESGWRSATPANLLKLATALNCPPVSLERKR